MTLLLLGGSGAATVIAAALARRGCDAVASIAGGARLGGTADLPCRVGGFGGEAGFRDYVARAGISAVLDATHPFAARITARTARLCAALGLPYCLLWRPEWVPAAADRWTFVNRDEAAAEVIPRSAVVFLATGRAGLARQAGLAGRRVYCRRIGPCTEPFPYPGGAFVPGVPPFSVAQEMALFKRLGVDWLVVRNAGGSASRGKLVAAQRLGLSVVMVRRPAPPPAARRVATVKAALGWAARL